MAEDERTIHAAINEEVEELEQMRIVSTQEKEIEDISQAQQLSTIQYDVEIFIDLVKEEPCLWNTSCRAYKEQNKKRNAWSKIVTIFGKDVEFLKAQWKNLKENMKRCLDKRNRMTKSGAAAQALPKCKYFENLLFLNDKISNKDTDSNISLPENLINTSLQTSHANLSMPTTSVSPLPESPPHTDTEAPKDPEHYASISHGKRKCYSDTTPHTPKQKKAAKEDLSTRIDALTLRYLEDMKSTEKECELLDKEDDPDLLFFKSLLPCMKKLPKRKNRQARMKIQEVLFTLEAEFELTVCNVQFAHRFGLNSENCISLFKTMCKKNQT